jgi:hypothetical protein
MSRAEILERIAAAVKTGIYILHLRYILISIRHLPALDSTATLRCAEFAALNFRPSVIFRRTKPHSEESLCYLNRDTIVSSLS